jgi:hypothetical protein
VRFPIRFPSSKLAGVLAAIALVAVSAVGLRLSDPKGTVDMVSGVPGKPVTFNDGELSVDRVRVGTVLTQNDEVRDRSAGMFVAVAVTGAATGPRELSLGSAELVSKDVHYKTYGLTSVFAAPGFKTSTDIVFEVDPSRVEGLTLEMWRNEVISGYQQRVRIPLGITAANANQWGDAARGWGIDISLSNSTRPIP